MPSLDTKPKPRGGLQEQPPEAPAIDPWRSAPTEREARAPEAEEPNPLRTMTQTESAPVSMQGGSPSDQSEQGPPSEKLPHTTAEQARPTVRWVLRFGAAVLDPNQPPTDDEVNSTAESAAAALPSWVFSPWIRLVSSVLAFVTVRIESKAKPKGDRTPERIRAEGAAKLAVTNQ